MQLVIDYPPSLPDMLQQSQKQFEQEARMAMAVRLFEMKHLSLPAWLPNWWAWIGFLSC